MPGLAQRNDQFSNASSYLSSACTNGSASSNGFWSKHGNDISYNQLHKFWSELSPQARQQLLRVDKQTLFEQARKNMYCSRCNGLLLEGFLQIVLYGKSLQQEGGVGHLSCNRTGVAKGIDDGGSSRTNGCQDETQDPSVHPWGGLTTTRDGILTLLDSYLYSKSLKGLQNVFDSAHARERERELLYPDACGGGGRGWISQGLTNYGRGHGTRETCALHTARLSCDTLVDFWSALGEDTRQSLLRMKEDDFIERLMYRFDSKRFCRDCRRNVIREFKELKELKRMRRETHCTSWFCVADTAFQYEVSDDTVQADWCQTLMDAVGKYHHFEWAVGTGEGKSDILEFKNVGMNSRAQASGLELGGLSACYITLKAWKLDGRCSELSVKAHALKGQQCVHCRLVVGDGYVAITRGESIRRFFEHAEEAEEEEDDDSMDKDGNELDGECSRPQKHAKSPELAREFLLDAATVIFKEQVEKAFREGTARQNAHSIFVCLALKLLEERVHVACKEIITLEKQMKLLEEEEKEKREEEERKERKRTKEREKKLRRKERLRGKERDREQKTSESNQDPIVPDVTKNKLSPNISEAMSSSRDSVSDTTDTVFSRLKSPEVQDKQLSCERVASEMQFQFNDSGPNGEYTDATDGNGPFMVEQSKFTRRRTKYRREFQMDPSFKWSDKRRFAVHSEIGSMTSKADLKYHGENFDNPYKGFNGSHRQMRINGAKANGRNCSHRFSEDVLSNNKVTSRYDLHSCSCNQHCDYRVKVEPHISGVRLGWEARSMSKPESTVDMSKQFYRGGKFSQIDYVHESCGRIKGKVSASNNTSNRVLLHTKKVWEPLEPKKYPRSNSDSDITLRSSELKDGVEHDNDCEKTIVATHTVEDFNVFNHDNSLKGTGLPSQEGCQNGFDKELSSHCCSAENVYEGVISTQDSTSSVTTDPSISDNCSSSLSEGDNTASCNTPNMESSSISDSDDVIQKAEAIEAPTCSQNSFPECGRMEEQQNTNGEEPFGDQSLSACPADDIGGKLLENPPAKFACGSDDTGNSVGIVGLQHHCLLPSAHNQTLRFPVFQAPSTMDFYHQNSVSWPAAPAPNGLVSFPHSSHYLFASPIGYGLNGTSRYCMQYGPLQHLPTPFFNPGQGRVYRPAAKADGMATEEQNKLHKPGEGHEGSNGVNAERVFPAGTAQAKEQTGSNGFSLFHFGGPVSLSTGQKPPDSVSNEGTTAAVSSPLPAAHVQGDCSCSKETTIEEYNLFASSNGIRFSFF